MSTRTVLTSIRLLPNQMTSNPRMQMLVEMGFVVAIVDGRGSFHRGIAFEGHLHHRMGQVEVADQVALVDYLVHKLKITDPDRVAITGCGSLRWFYLGAYCINHFLFSVCFFSSWSYGGYMTLLSMSQRPDVFRAGVSGAPVAYWEVC